MEEIKIPQIINSVSKYIEAVFKLRKSSLDDPNGTQYWFFRGQKSADWSARPSAFRNDALSVESNIIQNALRQRPFDFRDCQSNFEVLTKLQHYGLGTRLLDVTLNPLVALYFACEKYEDLQYGKGKRGKLEPKDGKVYFKYTYGHKITELDIKVACSLPFIELKDGDTVKILVDKLKENNSINNDEYAYLLNDDYKNIIPIIQSNNYVVSSYSNDRLVRQSGSFIVPTAIKIIRNDKDFKNSIVRKTICDLDHEFEEHYFIIPHSKKEEILEELDFLNINKATLFPELEHQLIYLQEKKLSSKVHIEQFEKIEQITSVTSSIEESIHFNEPNINSKEIIDNYELEEKTSKKILSVINENKSLTDWWRKETILSTMRIEISQILQSTYSASESKEIAKDIVSKISEGGN